MQIGKRAPRVRPSSRQNATKRRGDLRQMRDADHLMIAQRLHLGTNGVRDFAADVRVDLVEHEQWNCVMRSQRGFDRQHHREISPLDAIARSGFNGSPGFGENSNSTESNPFRVRLFESG
jgi:hypothetical protein